MLQEIYSISFANFNRTLSSYNFSHLEQYPITRLLYVIVKQNGTEEQLAGKAYADLILTKQGQQLISQAGLIKMR